MSSEGALTLSDKTVIRVREYGSHGPHLIVLHGGPGTPGGMAPLARELSDSFHVYEPFQRGSGEQPLTVASHIADLHKLVESFDRGVRPALVGHSWGAMLALAYAAARPDRATCLVLISCGTFDPVARRHLRAIIEDRTDDNLRQRMARLSEEVADIDGRLSAQGRLIEPLYMYDPIPGEPPEPVDGRAHEETWNDMVRLQEEGVYPAAFSAIDAPVAILHGAYDPHPGPMIRASLEPYIPHLEYREWEQCGHEPWREKAVRDDFFVELREWLNRHSA